MEKGKKGGIILKIDLEKAYDKISWKFLLDTLIFFNLNPSWTALIMDCVSSVSTSILWNGEALENFTPGRGLRQGDPLSPYLFVLCMERLSILIENKCETGNWKGLKISRDAVPLTHLFFADDLLLFGHSNQATCRDIMDVLNEFCALSGQTINLLKSKFYVSPNIPRNKARRLSNTCGIALTNNLGKYLGVPILHGRAKKEHFNYIIEKVQNRLAGWKSNTLMIAGRATLVQASSSTIPNYTMQTMHLPSSVCDRIDRLNRDFLWGDTPDKRKIHLVNWHNVCKSKDKGGLGLKKAKNQNLALLTKLGWKIANNEDNLWVKILRDKYLKHHNIQSWPNNRSASFTWRSIMHIRDILAKRTKWTIGNGKSVDVWKDWWCGNMALAEKYPGIHTLGNFKVADLIEDGNWNLSPIEQFVDSVTRNDILSITLPVFTQAEDHPSWVEAPNGSCSVSTAYDFINKDNNDTEGWKWFWKLHLPQKFKTFLWLIFHNKLPTNHLRARRGMTSLDLCPRCNNSPEILQHLFRDCPKAIATWDKLPSGHLMRKNFGSTTMEWVSHNLKKKRLLNTGTSIPWNTLFCTALWQIWKDRNRKSFDNIELNPEVSSNLICSYAKEIVGAFKNPLIPGPNPNRLTPWCPPIADNLKLNTDGCWYDRNRNAGFGGLVRNDQGEWQIGYYGKMLTSSSLETEIWSIYRGLTIILEKGWTNVRIESDSQTAVTLFTEETNANHPQSNILNDGKYLINRTGSSIVHIFRGANEAADCLAHLGASQNEELVVTPTPPLAVREVMIRDSLNLHQVLD